MPGKTQLFCATTQPQKSGKAQAQERGLHLLQAGTHPGL